MDCPRHIGSFPPATPEGMEELRGIGKALDVRLDRPERGALVLLFRCQHDQLVDAPLLELLPCEIAVGAGSLERPGVRRGIILVVL